MLRGVYAPSDFVSRNLDPQINPEQKIAIISRSKVIVTPKPGINLSRFEVTLPYSDGGEFAYGFNHNPEILFTDYLSVGDEELYRKGLGSRMLMVACRYATERSNRVCVFATGWARLGLLNTAVRVFGDDKVSAVKGKERYGWNGKKSLEEMFDDYPPEEGRKYLVDRVEAYIDREQAGKWEQPEVVDTSE